MLPCNAVLESKESRYPYSDEGGVHNFVKVHMVQIKSRVGVAFVLWFLLMRFPMFFVKNQS